MTKAEISIVLMQDEMFHVDVVGATQDISEAIYYALQTFEEQKQHNLIEAFVTGLVAYSMENKLDLGQMIIDGMKRVKPKP